MIVGTKRLLQLVKEQKLVEGLARRELKNPEGAGFDLRVEKLLVLTSESFLGITHRETSELEEVASYKKGVNKQLIHPIKSGEFYLAKTIERVNLPKDLIGIIKPRTTLLRCGISMRTGFCNPGYQGDLYFGIYNVSDQVFKLEMGARFVHIVFFEVSGELVRQYEGQWQGGRGTTKEQVRGLEKQT